MATLSLLAFVAVQAGAAEPAVVPHRPWFPKATPLPKPAGEVIRVATVEQLFAAADKVQPGGTILVAEGRYRLPRFFELRTDGVTLRGESGNRDKVVLDGEGRLGELVGITRAAGVTIADLTIQNATWNGFKINSDKGATRVTIHNCVIHNIWQRGIKGPAVPKDMREQQKLPADCRVQFCLFYNDRPKRFTDDPADRPENFNGNYVGGIDVMYPKGWTISDNVFLGIQGRTREARGAVFLWHDAQDCLVERNIVVDCDCGICLGNSHRPPGIAIHCTRCVVRNNFVVRCPENGILADYTRECKILHNTIHDPNPRLRRLIRLVHDNDGLVVSNNLLSGPAMRIESASPMTVENNRTKEMGGFFVSPADGDLHLKPGGLTAAGTVKRLADVSEDIDRSLRPAWTAVGADQPHQP